VVVGNGMAGMRTVEELLRLAPDLYDITVVGSEPHGNYNRIQLSPVLAGELAVSDIMLHAPSWYQAQGITLRNACTATRIDRARREVHLDQGGTLPYDRLLLATGSSPFIPDIPGATLKGVVGYRDIADVEEMIRSARDFRHAVIIGGGLLGLEAAAGLAKRGMQVTVVHVTGWLMERQLDQCAAKTLQQALQVRGIEFLLDAQTAAFDGNSGRVEAVRLKDGRTLQADVVVVAAGIRPRTALARDAKLQCNRGVLVNDALQTYDPRIYAVGECAEHRGIAYGLVAPLYEQALVCANHLARYGYSTYRGSRLSTRLKVTGIDVFSAGWFSPSAEAEDIVLFDPEALVYQRAVIQNDVLVGAVMVGDTSTAAWLLGLINTRANVSALRDHLFFGAPPKEAAVPEEVQEAAIVEVAT
jgi:nitrite reductase (NADH) large subunit